MLDTHEVKTAPELDEWRSSWETLLESSDHADFFQTPEWLTTWLNHHWRDKPISFVFVTENRTPVAMAPLLYDDDGELGCARCVVTPVNDHTPRSNILYSGDPDEILRALLRHFSQRQSGVRLRLRSVSSAPVADSFSRAAHESGIGSTARRGLDSPIVHIDTDWETYLKRRSRHFRSEHRRKRAKLERAGRVEYLRAGTVDETERAMEDVIRIERNSWKESAGTSITGDPRLLSFYSDIAVLCAQRGWMSIKVLYLDGAPVAYLYGVTYRDEYYAIKTSYDRSYRHLSPGAVLFGKVLQDAFEEGLTAFDLLGIESRWKLELTDAVRPRLDLCAFSNASLRCHVCAVYHAYLKPMIKRRLPFIATFRKKLDALRPGRR